jgi:hypothetical protein
MADTAKKTKAPAKPSKATTTKQKAAQSSIPSMASSEEMKKSSAKPRTAAAKKTNGAAAARPAMPPREEIEKLAKQYWAERGYVDGYAEQDWLRAERELLQMAS